MESNPTLPDRLERDHIYEDTEDSIAAAVQEVLNNNQASEIRLHHYFDYIAGTSTGGYAKAL
jgi:hypothetical protein